MYTCSLSFVIVILSLEKGGEHVSNIYDSAYSLEKAIRESQEFNTLKEIFEVVMNDNSSKKLFEDFRNKQIEIQEKQMQGQDISEEELEQVKQVVDLVQQDEDITKLMDAEQRLNVLINDISRIITKPLEEIYSQHEE